MTKAILILAANPKNTPPLRLDQELREINNGLERAQKRGEFTLTQKLAVRPIDIRRAMLDCKPNIVHFCGHGSGKEGLAFEDETGQTKLVSTDALAGFFELFADKLECVLLNACYSKIQAQAIAKHIPYVIGMKKAIGDAAAIEFAVAFYDALGVGESVDFAYKLACNAIQMQGLADGHLTPVLIARQSSEIAYEPPNAGEDLFKEQFANAKHIKNIMLQVYQRCQENRLKEGAALLLGAGENQENKVKKEINEAFSFLMANWHKSAEVSKLLIDYVVATTHVTSLLWIPLERIRQLETAIHAAEYVGNDKVQWGLKINLANAHWMEAHVEQAKQLYMEILQNHHHKAYNLNFDELCAVYIGLGCCYAADNNLNEATKNFDQAKYIAERTNRQRLLGHALCSIGDVTLRQGNGNAAVSIDHYLKALNIAEREKDIALQIKVLRGCGDVYTRYGLVTEANHKYSQSLRLAEDIGDSLSVAAISLNKNLSPVIARDPLYAEDIRTKLLEIRQELEQALRRQGLLTE